MYRRSGGRIITNITNRNQFRAWLRKQPREAAVALAACKALRVLPVVQTAKGGSYTNGLVLPVFRAASVAWAAAKYPAYETEFVTSAAYAYAYAYAYATYATYAAAAVDTTYAAADTTYAAAADAAAYAGAYSDARTYADDASAGDAGDAAHASAYAGDAATPFFWSAVSTDATSLEEGTTAASVIARLPLWPQGQPDHLRSLWQELEARLLAAKQDWQVWTNWYNDRVDNRVREEERELAYVHIDEALWNRGPAIVNAEIARRVEGS